MISKVAKEYGIEDIKKIEKLDLKTTNELYKVESEEGNFLIKKLTSPHKNEDNIRAQIGIALHMEKKGLPTILPLKNKKGDFLSTHENQIYLVYPYIKLDKEPKEDIRFAARTLAEFHKAMEDYEQKHEFHTKPLHTATIDITNFTEYDERLSRLSVIENLKKNNTEFAEKVRKDSELIQELIDYVLENLNDAEFSKKTVLHYDYKKDNLFFSEGKLVAISDFDYSHVGYIETDVAKAAKYWSEDKGKIDIEKFKSFVEEYSKHNNINTNLRMYRMLTVYIVLRRIIHAAQLTLESIKDLEFLYDYDIKLLKSLKENKAIFS